MAESRYELAYQESLRAISDQQQAIDALQTRAGIVASAAAVVVSIAVTQLSRVGDLPLGLRIALLGYLGIALCSGFVLWPRRMWRLHFGISDLHWSYIEGPRSVSLDAMYRDLGLYLDRYFVANASKVDQMAWALTGSLTLLLMSTVVLVYELWSS